MIQHVWMIVPMLGLALFLGRMLAPFVPLPSHGRDVSIDGLRGYLAFLVFLHHGTVWYAFLRGADWVPPPSHVLAHAGEGSVLLFFMITGLLFWRKVLQARPGGIDWPALFLSRIFRLAPLYLAVTVAILLLALAATGFRIVHPIPVLAKGVFQWASFTLLGTPDLNGLLHTKLIVANVTWSLRFEWFFYLLLPAGALLAGRRPGLLWSLLGIAVGVAAIHQRLDPARCAAFLGGIAAAHLQPRLSSISWIRGHAGSLLASIVLLLAVAASHRAYHPTSLVLYATTFVLLGSGSHLFGLLHLRSARVLGELSYSIYLVHGIVLWSLLRWGGAYRDFLLADEIRFWSALPLAAVLVVGLSFATWKFIERPGMRLGTAAKVRLDSFRRRGLPT